MSLKVGCFPYMLLGRRYGGGNSTSAEEVVLQIPASLSLILVGWCEEGHPATKNLLQLSQDRQLPYGD